MAEPAYKVKENSPDAKIRGDKSESYRDAVKEHDSVKITPLYTQGNYGGTQPRQNVAGTAARAAHANVESMVYSAAVLGGAAGGAVAQGSQGSVIKTENKERVGEGSVKDKYTDRIKDQLIKPSAEEQHKSKPPELPASTPGAGGVGGGRKPGGDGKQAKASYGSRKGKNAGQGRQKKRGEEGGKREPGGGKKAKNAPNKNSRGINTSGAASKVINAAAFVGGDDDKDRKEFSDRAVRAPATVLRTTRYTARATGKVARTAFKLTAKTARAAYKTVKYTAAAFKKLAANPLVLKGMLMVILVVLHVAVVFAVLTSVMSLVPSITLKSDDIELTKTYEHITKLDATLTASIRSERANNSGIDQYHFTVNGHAANAEGITIITNADLVLVYLDCKYEEYAFDKLIHGLLGGTNVEGEVTALHNELHSYTTNKWTETIQRSSVQIDPETGAETTTTWTETIQHMSVDVRTKSFEVYIHENKNTLLTKLEQEQFEVLQEVGPYEARARLGSPFHGQSYYISSRWGWRIHPITGSVHKHGGVDIPKPAGTPINNVMVGTVTDVGYDENGRGNYVVVAHGTNRVVYAHLRGIAVRTGRELRVGDIIGYVGSTGSSTGPHLHIEYWIDDFFNTNPAFFMRGAYNTSRYGGNDIVEVAALQIGNGGHEYWSWYGFGARVEWCAIFVTWCANQLGYTSSGIMPRFASCRLGIAWFRERGMWQPPGSGYIPSPGDIIFFDWDRDGAANHVGIVERVDGNRVYTIEGNSGGHPGIVRTKSYSITDNRIFGYATPPYPATQAQAAA